MSRAFSILFCPGSWCGIFRRDCEWGICDVDIMDTDSSSIIHCNTQNPVIMGYDYLLRCVDHADVIAKLEGAQHSSEDSESQGSRDLRAILFVTICTGIQARLLLRIYMRLSMEL